MLPTEIIQHSKHISIRHSGFLISIQHPLINILYAGFYQRIFVNTLYKLQRIDTTAPQQMIHIMVVVFTGISQFNKRNIMFGRSLQQKLFVLESICSISNNPLYEHVSRPLSYIGRRFLSYDVRSLAYLPTVI